MSSSDSATNDKAATAKKCHCLKTWLFGPKPTYRISRNRTKDIHANQMPLSIIVWSYSYNQASEHVHHATLHKAVSRERNLSVINSHEPFHMAHL